MITEKHKLYYRGEKGKPPILMSEHATYEEAVIEGYYQAGHGKYWVESYEIVDGRWEEFAPQLT